MAVIWNKNCKARGGKIFISHAYNAIKILKRKLTTL